MNHAVNEVVARNSKGNPYLISAPVKELLNLRRLPAMLDMGQTAAMLGVEKHHIPVLARAGLLKPLGNVPPRSTIKFFATVQVMELAGEVATLNKIRSTLYGHWRDKNARRRKLGARPYDG